MLLSCKNILSLLTGILESSCGTSVPMPVLGVVVAGFVVAGAAVVAGV